MAVDLFDPTRLSAKRRELKLSQRAFAQKVGVSQALIAELERGKHPPSSRSMEKVCRALGVEADYFNIS